MTSEMNRDVIHVEIKNGSRRFHWTFKKGIHGYWNYFRRRILFWRFKKVSKSFYWIVEK